MSRFGQQRGQSGGQVGGGFRGGTPLNAPAPDQRIMKFWADYLKGGYFDAEGNLRIEYVSRERVERLAQEMCATGTLTTHQIRRYFGHCRAVETKLRGTGVEWLAIWPMIKKLDISAADGAAKQPAPKIPELFHDFIRSNIAAIKSQKDFLEGFLPHFEAVIGFGQAHFKSGKN
jgi:CRISPR type III-A-associated protein Csm2